MIDLELIGEDALLWTSVLSLAMLIAEWTVGFATGKLRLLEVKETISSLGTLVGYVIGELAVRMLLIGALFWTYEQTAWQLPIELWSTLAAILAADFIYYWQHRLSHASWFFWLAHSVHHSSPVFNSSVNFRLSIIDPLLAIPFMIPMILVGFHPGQVVFAQIIVLAYQSWIHTELIGKLPVLDWFLNTPSNHRVHHGVDDIYLDKNFGGIFMIWDHLFGTYQAETHRPVYGLTTPLNSQNPLRVWFSEFPPLLRALRRAPDLKSAARILFGPPGISDPIPQTPGVQTGDRQRV
ncbi:MAG: sterol desaturase family protein [bacterium]|nr:sterol desaturase family protein [bacterium]